MITLMMVGLFFPVLILILVFALPLIALLDIMKNDFPGNDKLIWVLIVLLLPILGSILYFLIGTSKKF